MKLGFIGLAFVFSAHLLPSAAAAEAPRLQGLLQVHAVESSVLLSLSNEDINRDSDVSNYRGGVSGGTHIMIGSVMMAASALVGSFVFGSEGDGVTNGDVLVILIPGVFVVGAVETIYGIVRVATSKNDFR